MKNKKHSMIPFAAGLVAILMSSAATIGTAQGTMPMGTKMPMHQEGMKGMPGMMDGPHHVLAMAYRDNLMTFAKALQGQVTKTKSVNLDMARPAAAEMRRSFDQMKEHHLAQVSMMGDHPTPAMMDTKQHMETHLTAVNEHLTELEAELNAAAPDPKKVAEHTAMILKHCAGMSEMSGMAKPHQMK